MKKIKHILVCGLAVVASAVAVQAQTLTQDWKVTKNLPSAAEGRAGVGFEGKVYTNFKANKSIVSFDGSKTETLLAGKSGSGVGISRDSKGNLIIVNGWAAAGSMKSFVLYNVATKESKTVNVTLPDGVTAARMDFIGRAAGDVFSEEGAALFIIGSGQSVAAKIFIAKGEYVAAKSKALPKLPFTVDNMTIIQPLTESPESDDVAVRCRSNRDFYHYDGSKWVAYKRVGTVGTGGGGDVVTLNGRLFTIEQAGTDYRDGFQIVDRKTNTVVAAHEPTASVVSNNSYPYTLLSVEKIDEYTARVYQYHGGAFAAQYTFSLPKMYILGQNEVGDAWNPTSGIAMTWESGNVWSATVTTAPGRENLGFVSVLAENNDERGWTYVNGNRWGLENDKQEGALAEKLTVSKNSNSINVGVGTFFIRMNLDDNTLYIAPTKLYVIGTSNKAEGHHWASDDDSYMAESNPETPGVFTFDPIDLKVEGKAVGEEAEEDLAYFAFVTGIDAEWGPVNNSRWCPDNKDGELTDNTDFTDFGKHYNGAFCIKNGAYKLTVDLNTKTVKAVYLTSSGVGQVGAEAAGVIAADGQIRIVGDAATVSVYNAAGQAVAINSAERTFAVARGMYVVVVDGKATKVIVR